MAIIDDLMATAMTLRSSAGATVAGVSVRAEYNRITRTVVFYVASVPMDAVSARALVAQLQG